MKIHFVDVSSYVGMIMGRMNCDACQSDVGSGASGLNRSRERSNERHWPADISETFSL